MEQKELTARAAYDTDWHVFVDDPKRGPLGYCTGVGPDEAFEPAAATAVLEDDGWKVTGQWQEMPEDCDEPYTVTVAPARKTVAR